MLINYFEDKKVVLTMPGTRDPRIYSMIGGYPLFYYGEGQVFCPACAAVREKEGVSLCREVNWENPDLFCDCCDDQLESAYGDK